MLFFIRTRLHQAFAPGMHSCLILVPCSLGGSVATKEVISLWLRSRRSATAIRERLNWMKARGHRAPHFFALGRLGRRRSGRASRMVMPPSADSEENTPWLVSTVMMSSHRVMDQ